MTSRLPSTFISSFVVGSLYLIEGPFSTPLQSLARIFKIMHNFKIAKSKDTDQTAMVGRLVCIFVLIQPKHVFARRGTIKE